MNCVRTLWNTCSYQGNWQDNWAEIHGLLQKLTYLCHSHTIWLPRSMEILQQVMGEETPQAIVKVDGVSGYWWIGISVWVETWQVGSKFSRLEMLGSTTGSEMIGIRLHLIFICWNTLDIFPRDLIEVLKSSWVGFKNYDGITICSNINYDIYLPPP
jgi:hypothetical protein